MAGTCEESTLSFSPVGNELAKYNTAQSRSERTSCYQNVRTELRKSRKSDLDDNFSFRQQLGGSKTNKPIRKMSLPLTSNNNGLDIFKRIKYI